MDVSEAIKGRRSTRNFKLDKVTKRDVERLIEAAVSAPSAGNIQPWELVVARKPEIRRKLVEAAYGQLFIEEAPVVIVVCANEDRSSQRYGLRGKTLFCLQDTAAATQNMLLTAYSLGLGTCWVGAFKEDEVREALKIPMGIRPVAIVPVGYPSISASARRKRPMEQVVHRETF